MDIAEILGTQIKKFRLLKNMTQEDLAYKSNLPVAKISKLELGKSNPTIKTIQKVSDGLGIPLCHLFTGSSDNTIERLTPLFPIQEKIDRLPEELQATLMELISKISAMNSHNN